jgi:hypothetical protein
MSARLKAPAGTVIASGMKGPAKGVTSLLKSPVEILFEALV